MGVKEYDCYNCSHYGVCYKIRQWGIRTDNAGLYCPSFAKKQSKVVNAIFDDIEVSLAVHAFTSKSEDYADGAADTIEWVDAKIDELRKKYVGGQA